MDGNDRKDRVSTSYRRCDHQKAIDYHEKHLKIAKEIGDLAAQGGAYGNLGNTYQSLGDYEKAIEYHEKHLKIAKEIAHQAEEGEAYGNLANAFQSMGCLLYTSPSPRDGLLSRMPSSA